jgi:indolepyruvate ferredoxin oxidoreductase
VDPDLVEQAISLNGVAVRKNMAAFRWGRAWAADPAAVEAQRDRAEGAPEPDPRPLRQRLHDDLADYMSAAYAARFDRLVDVAATAGNERFTEAVMRHAHKLMAYKDEYEVARLFLLPESRERARRVGGRRTKITFHLHPPALRALGMRRKLKISAGARPMFYALRAMRRLRGTPLDFFGHTELRRIERAMVTEYEEAVATLSNRLRTDPSFADEAVAIAELPDRVRGYEHLKMQRAEAYRVELARRMSAATSR